MNGRKNFLTTLFQSLDAKKIQWCVLRNYDGLMDESASTDLDLLVDENELRAFNEVLQLAAKKTGQLFVHHARFVNHSCVFWNEQSGFTRVDFDTEIRWRRFPVLTGQEILEERQRRHDYFVPHPKHETVVLFTQAIWVGKLDQRYREQLARLYAACDDKEELRKTFRKAFGGAVGELMEFQANVLCRGFSESLGRLKRSSIAKTFLRPGQSALFVKYVFADVRRFWQRTRQPAGISLLFASPNAQETDLGGFMREMEFLFPAQKSQVHRTNLSDGREIRPCGIGLALERLRTLFRGGLFVEFYRVANDAALETIFKSSSPAFYSSRCFRLVADSKGRACLEHLGTGLRRESMEAHHNPASLCALLVQSISAVLEKENTGKFCW